MKNTYSLLIVLLLVFAPLQAQSDKIFSEMGLSLDLHIEKEGTLKPDKSPHAQELLPLLLALELMLLDTALKVTENSISTIPRYLSSLHILDIEPTTFGIFKNEPSYVLSLDQKIENTFFPWLRVIDYGPIIPHAQQQLSRGFGPFISI